MQRTALETVKEAYQEGRENTLNKKTLTLAYLQLHLNNPGLHPDNYLEYDGGYCGWHVLLVYRVWTEFSNLPDYVKYPTAPFRFVEWGYDQFVGFHSDDEDDMFRDKLDHTYNWLLSMSVQELAATLIDLEDLVMYHDGSPEDQFGIISQLCEVLAFVNGLSK